MPKIGAVGPPPHRQKRKGLTPFYLCLWHFAVMSKTPLAYWVSIADRPSVVFLDLALEGVACGGHNNLACG